MEYFPPHRLNHPPLRLNPRTNMIPLHNDTFRGYTSRFLNADNGGNGGPIRSRYTGRPPRSYSASTKKVLRKLASRPRNAGRVGSRIMFQSPKGPPATPLIKYLCSLTICLGA